MFAGTIACILKSRVVDSMVSASGSREVCLIRWRVGVRATVSTVGDTFTGGGKMLARLRIGAAADVKEREAEA